MKKNKDDMSWSKFLAYLLLFALLFYAMHYVFAFIREADQYNEIQIKKIG